MDALLVASKSKVHLQDLNLLTSQSIVAKFGDPFFEIVHVCYLFLLS
jgi:hypothetical protein